jgi:Zn finger protein HypA/HybF involved in hydrogenase expression
MADFKHTDDKRVIRQSPQKEKTQKEKNTGICDICGQEMERDPESGEYFCPDCDSADY